MLRQKRIVIINNTISERNPALISIEQALSAAFQVTIIGKEKLEGNNFGSSRYIDNKLIIHALKIPFLGLNSLFKLLGKEYNGIAVLYIYTILYNWFILFRLFFLRFDLVLCLETESLQNARKIKFFFKKPIAYFIYELYSHQQIITDKSLHHKLASKIERNGLQYADVLISSVNDVLGRYLISEYKLKNKEIVSYTICPPNPDRWSNDKVIENPIKFYYHGALFPNRGLEEAILAMQNVEGAILYIRGFGAHEEYLRNLTKENGLDSRVIFLAPVSTSQLTVEAVKFDVGLTLVRMNILNHQYACGFKTFENTAAGLALIVPKSYPLEPFISKHQNGMVYDDATVDHLTAAFNYCVENRDLVLQWKINSQKAYGQEYNPMIQAERLRSVFNKYMY